MTHLFPLVLFVPLTAASVSATTPSPTANRLVCGPQCVWYVLKYHGIETDQTELIRRVQWPRLEEGTSFADLSRLLEEEGLQTVALRVDRRFLPRPAAPVILHFKPSADQSLGHFVVLLPGGEGRERLVWNPGGGKQVWTEDRLRTRMSGAVLLASSDPIGDPEALLDGSDRTLGAWLIALAAGQAVVLASLLITTLSRRRPSGLLHRVRV